MRNLPAVWMLLAWSWCQSCSMAAATGEIGFTQMEVGGDIALASAAGGVPPSASQDIGSAFGLGERQDSPYARGQVELGTLVFTASAFRFAERGQGVLNATFGGLAKDTAVSTDLEFANCKLSGAFDIDLGPVTLSPGLAVDLFDFRFQATETTFGNSERIDEFLPVPMLFLRAAAEAGILAAAVEVGYLQTPEIDASEVLLLDLEALVELRVAPGFHVFGGYRAMDIDGRGETDSSSFEVDLSVRGWVIGGGVRF
ncbi:MAG: hypothetical protein Q7T30_01895 [Planctomycetota bacterium]|nr:hypothetical protein [Planctomycetota bacterium]